MPIIKTHIVLFIRILPSISKGIDLEIVSGFTALPYAHQTILGKHMMWILFAHWWQTVIWAFRILGVRAFLRGLAKGLVHESLTTRAFRQCLRRWKARLVPFPSSRLDNREVWMANRKVYCERLAACCVLYVDALVRSFTALARFVRTNSARANFYTPVHVIDGTVRSSALRKRRIQFYWNFKHYNSCAMKNWLK